MIPQCTSEVILSEDDVNLDEWTRITFYEDGTYTGALGRIGRDSLPLLLKYDERILR